MANKGVKIHIVGPRVQGVGFRYYIWERANRLGITGYVKNQADGSVEIEAYGEESKLEKLVKYAERGPELANISEVLFEFIPYKEQYTSFNIKR